jgi:AraC-like DNA-binding protein
MSGAVVGEVMDGCSASDRRELVIGDPCPVLRGFVQGYWGYFESAAWPVRRVEPSSGTVGLIVGFGPPVRVAYPHRRGGSPARVGSFVAGLHDSYAVAESAGWQHGLQIGLTPIGAHRLLGVSMDSLANRVIELEQVLGRFALDLALQLYETVGWQARFDVLDALIGRRLADAQQATPAVDWAWRRLTQTGGRLGIGALADELGASRQYVATRFREEIGLPPKTVARILRFQRAVVLLKRHDEVPPEPPSARMRLARPGALQPDFRTFAGSTPRQLLARRLPDGAGVLADSAGRPVGIRMTSVQAGADAAP